MWSAYLLEGGKPAYCDGREENMTLVVALLRQDHIVVAADRRHTRGDRYANYRDDCDVKLVSMLDGRGVFGLSGHDLSEQIAVRALNARVLEKPSLSSAADSLSTFAKTQYETYVPN
jgi:hypothetical protein